MITVLWTKSFKKLIAELKELREFKQLVEETLNNQSADCGVFFDFNNPDIKVYSIERVPYGARVKCGQHEIGEHTLICWTDKEQKNHEWLCWCSPKRHDELVAEFRKSKEAKKAR